MNGSSLVSLGDGSKYQHVGAADNPARGEDGDERFEKIEGGPRGVARFHSKRPAGLKLDSSMGSHLLSRGLSSRRGQLGRVLQQVARGLFLSTRRVCRRGCHRHSGMYGCGHV